MFSPYLAHVKMPVWNQICWWQKGSKSAPVDPCEFWTKKYPWGRKYSHGNSWCCACVRQKVPMPNPKNFRGILPHSPYWRLPHVDRQLTEVFSTKKNEKILYCGFLPIHSTQTALVYTSSVCRRPTFGPRYKYKKKTLAHLNLPKWQKIKKVRAPTMSGPPLDNYATWLSVNQQNELRLSQTYSTWPSNTQHTQLSQLNPDIKIN